MFSEQWAFGTIKVCFWDNRLSEKLTFGPMGHFLDYWVFGIMDHRKNGMAPELQASYKEHPNLTLNS